jgi:hypothetical protein
MVVARRAPASAALITDFIELSSIKSPDDPGRAKDEHPRPARLFHFSFRRASSGQAPAIALWNPKAEADQLTRTCNPRNSSRPIYNHGRCGLSIVIHVE